MEHDSTATSKNSRERDIKWLSLSGLAFSIVGIGFSIYLTVAHYTTSAVLACPDTGLINCAKVTSSIYSSIIGVPLVLPGLAFFIVMLFLQLPAAWRSGSRWIRHGRLGLAGIGLLMIFWLIYVELFKLNAICLYCTGVHVLTILLFLLTALGTALTAD